MDAYKAILFEGEAWYSTCVGSWVKQKDKPNSQHKPCEYFCIKQSRSTFKDNEPYFNGSLMLKSWNFSSMLGLANTSGTWNLGPHVN